jgi:N-acetylmuramoyl-L-alanine amidase
MSRTGDTGVAKISADDLFGNGYSIDGDGEDIRARVACANAVAASVLVSIHLDAFSDPSVGGAETIYSAARPFAQMSRRLGELVQRDIMAAYRGRGWSIPDRGVQNDFGQGARGLSPQGRAYHHLLVLGPASPPWFVHPSAMPGVMVEPLFITDPSEADLAATAKGQSAIALGLAHAIETYLASNTAGGGGSHAHMLCRQNDAGRRAATRVTSR